MSGSTEWRTPPEVFEKLDAEFDFNVDAAATPETALIRPGYYSGGRFYTAETDGTRREHYGSGDRVWCNPPYSPAPLLYRFVETARVTSREQDALWVMLLNATSTDVRWFHNFIWDRELHRPREGVEVRLLQGRIRFHDELNTPVPSPRYTNMVVVFHPPLRVL